MITYTVADINKFNPCYDPTRHLDADKEYTLLDFLDNDTCPAQDKIWVVTNFLDDKTNRLFAVWCAREAMKLVENPDPRAIKACSVAERFANGEASEEELRTARAAARAARAARAAASDAASEAAWGASAVAWDAAWGAARAAASDASDARATEERKQVEKLKEMIKELPGVKYVLQQL